MKPLARRLLHLERRLRRRPPPPDAWLRHLTDAELDELENLVVNAPSAMAADRCAELHRLALTRLSNPNLGPPAEENE